MHFCYVAFGLGASEKECSHSAVVWKGNWPGQVKENCSRCLKKNQSLSKHVLYRTLFKRWILNYGALLEFSFKFLTHLSVLSSHNFSLYQPVIEHTRITPSLSSWILPHLHHVCICMQWYGLPLQRTSCMVRFFDQHHIWCERVQRKNWCRFIYSAYFLPVLLKSIKVALTASTFPVLLV